MDAYSTEEEQIEAIKKWWQVNGSNVLIGIGLAILIVVGWQFWQDQKRATGEAASTIYGEVLQAAELAALPQSDAKDDNSAEESSATFTHLVGELKAQHEASEYAVFAALLLAKHHVNADDADKAEEELRWAIDHKSSQGVKLIAQLRLARVLIMKEQYDAALALIDSVDAGAQAPAFAAVKGDVLVRLGKLDAARAAYSKALNANEGNSGINPVVKMKYDNLAVVK